MKTAEELFEISCDFAPSKVAEILAGVREHIIERSEERANKGFVSYEIVLRQGERFMKVLLLLECIKLIKEFEDNGYKVVIVNRGTKDRIHFGIIVSWDGECANPIDGFRNSITEILYTTDQGVLYSIEDSSQKYERNDKCEL